MDDDNLTDIPFEVSILGFYPYVVSGSIYYFLVSIKWKHGIHPLATHTLRHRQLRKFTSYQGVNLLIGKVTFSLLPMYYMFFDLLVFDGMNALQIISEIWDSSCASWKLTFGYYIMEICMNIFLVMPMTQKLLWGILRVPWMQLKTCINSSQRGRD